MTKSALNTNEFDSYFGKYLNKLSGTTNLQEGFITGKENVIKFFNSIPESKLEYRYAPEKWSVKEVFQHIIDTERIFLYRCFRIARRDITPLTSFDQNIYIKPSKANNKSMKDLLFEFETNRNNSICILKSLSNEDLCFIGTSSGASMSARAAAFCIIGHDIWHMDIINERYL